jgi:hypothetical protein
MGIRTRGLDTGINAKRQAADRAAHAEAKAVIDRWNDQLALGRDRLWSPTIRAALLAGTPWLNVFCPGCGTSRAIDLRKVDRHPLASVATLVLGLRCSWCPESAPPAEDPRIARAPACGEGRGVNPRGSCRRCARCDASPPLCSRPSRTSPPGGPKRGRDGRMAPPGAKQKNGTKQESKMPSDQIP